MPQFALTDYATQPISLGRAAVFVAGPLAGPFGYWDGTEPIELTHIGITEQEIVPPRDDQFSRLKLPEHTGGIALEAYHQGPGDDPQLTFNVVDGTPAAFELFSPRGKRSRGSRRQGVVKKHTLVLFPEALFVDADGDETSIAYTTADEWKIGGEDPTPRQLALLELSIWHWKVFFHSTSPVMQNEDGLSPANRSGPH